VRKGQMDRQQYRQANIYTDKTDRQTDRDSGRHEGRQRDGQTDKEIKELI
jgi:hypothetical protein